jgi:GNAT superfamily N-acetyltransferase
MLRPFDRERDEALVFSSWCSQIRSRAPFSRMGKKRFARYKADVIERLVDRCGVTVAANRENPWRIYGWCCGEELPAGDQVLHFLYVQNTFRHHGIGTKLLRVVLPYFDRKPFWYTHPTKAMSGYLAERWGCTYRPNLARSRQSENEDPHSRARAVDPAGDLGVDQR